ncbi:TetR/AcrR family transcriptional regulator [Allokutzneria albata]|uniref:DNA-binding transcriptional regulator, AcrR family n=1 Tax=Allokutzneria albata TaxID=211114 RepID=A0A1G9THT6_ALLAB|nr:TetR/AcrR family transcriptional regulator [Allokutzneria albata]SDM47074.1 DNA-binding transcriptional regulator, AcrR family [Allokutzneria albata]
MVEELGRRERKKQRTRAAIVEAAAELFERKGYEQTTVAEIAAAADLSTRTFFLHFPSKEDLLLANAQTRIDLGVRALAETRPGASVGEALAEAAERMIANSWENDLPSGLAAVRANLIATVPALQTGLMQRMVAGQTEMAEALHRAYADELDRVDAIALVGALLGAINAAALDSLRGGGSPEQVRAAMRRAVDLVVRRTSDRSGGGPDLRR